jgi:hypothetical protein
MQASIYLPPGKDHTMYDIVHVLDGLTTEINASIKEMSITEDLDQKKKLAEIIKMLCESLGIFFEGMGMMGPDFFDDFDDEHTEFSDDIVDFNSLKKDKKKKKKKKDDIPF